MKRILTLLSLLACGSFLNAEKKYPDYLYEIIGLLDQTSAHSHFGSSEGDLVGFFWQGEYDTALHLFNLLNKLKDEGVLKDDIEINTDEVGRTRVTSPSAKIELLKTVEQVPGTYRGWKLKEDFYTSATNEQLDLSFQSLYLRDGIPGYNILVNPSVPVERLTSYLYSDCFEIITLRTNTRTPDSLIVIFFPKEDDFSERLGITKIAGISITDEDFGLPWAMKIDDDSYDERYSISLHLEAFSGLDQRDKETRLDYFKWTISELNGDLHRFVDQDSEYSRSRAHEIEALIAHMNAVIVEAHNEWGYDSDPIDFDKEYSISRLIDILPKTHKTYPLEWALRKLNDDLRLYRLYGSDIAEKRIQGIEEQIRRIEAALKKDHNQSGDDNSE